MNYIERAVMGNKSRLVIMLTLKSENNYLH